MTVLEGLDVAIDLLDYARGQINLNEEEIKYYEEAYEAVESVYLQIKSRTEE